VQKDLSPVPFVGATGAAVNDLFQPLVAGMGPLKPNSHRRVGIPARIDSHPPGCRSSGTFPGVPEHWTYEAEAKLAKELWTVEDKLAAEHRATSSWTARTASRNVASIPNAASCWERTARR
jgi:hypothetical protein